MFRYDTPMTVRGCMGNHGIVLMGLSRSGKTTAGRCLAQSLGYHFYDTDELITKTTGLTPRCLYIEKGTEAFYRAEAEALQYCAQWSRHTDDPDVNDTGISRMPVIAAGGGLCDNSAALKILPAISYRFFLYAAEAVLFSRLSIDAEKTGAYPAFLQSLPVECSQTARLFFSELYKRRTDAYFDLCTDIIETDGLTCVETAAQIAGVLSRRAK